MRVLHVPSAVLLVLAGLVVMPGVASAAQPSCGIDGSGGFQPGEPKDAGLCFSNDFGDPISVAITQQGTHGIATVVGNNASQVRVHYTANAGTAGMTDSFKFRATNSGGELSEEVTRTVNIVANTDDPPVCKPAEQGSEPYYLGTARTAGSCSDPDGDSLTVAITQQGARGTAAVVSNGTPSPTVQYTASAQGPDSFKFQASDGAGPQSAVATANTFNAIYTVPDCYRFNFGDDSGGLNWKFGVGPGGPTIFGECQYMTTNPVHVTVTKQGTKGTMSIVNNDTPEPQLAYKASSIGADQVRYRASSQGRVSPEYTFDFTNFGGGGGGPFINISGGSSLGSVKVGKSGSFTLKRKVDCLGPGPSCKVTNALSAKVTASSAKKKTLKLGGSKLTVKAGKRGAIKLKLTKKGLRLLKRKRKIKAKLKTTVKRGATVTKKTFSVTLKAPKKR